MRAGRSQLLEFELNFKATFDLTILSKTAVKIGKHQILAFSTLFSKCTISKQYLLKTKALISFSEITKYILDKFNFVSLIN